MRRILPALFALVCSAGAFAQPFQNGGFELGAASADPCNIALPIGDSTISGWTVVAGNIERVNGCAWVASEATWSLDLVGNGNKGGIQQTFDTIPGRTYRVSFDMAGNPSVDYPPTVKPLTLTVPGAAYGFFFDTAGKSGSNMGWRPQARSFVASGSSSTISFVSDVSGDPFNSSFAGAALDNVRVTLLNSPATTWSAIVGTVTNPGQGGVPFPVPGSGGTVIDSHPTVVSDGTGPGPAVFTYSTDNSFCCHTGSWTFQATASAPGDLKIDWAYSGNHGTCHAYATLTAFVLRGGEIVWSSPLYGAEDPCLPDVPSSDPSNGFDHQGQVTFPALASGDTYGFTMVASNYDSNGAVMGRLEVSPTATAAPTLGTPVIVRALPLNSAIQPFLIGRIEGAPSTPVTVRLYGGTTCVDGVLGGTVAPIGADVAATTDIAGNFATLQGGAQGQFVAIGVVSPQVTPLSQCAVTAADNDSWPKALRLTGASATVDKDWIDVPGRARWYRFSILPGQSVQVTLSGLPADYDLAVFKDIFTEFVNELVPANSAQLTKLAAQFAPSAFSPSAFSPSAFSPSAFSPSAFSPSAFSPSAFSPSAFSPSAFSPSAFSPSAFSPSAFSPSAFSPSAFSPSAFSPSAFSDPSSAPSAFSADELAQAFSSAQTRSIIATSMTPGLGNESVLANTWNNTGDFYVRVTGRGAAFSGASYTLAVTKQGTSCASVTDTAISSRPPLANLGYQTIVLVDSTKTPLSSSVPGGTLQSKLSAFVQRNDVKGVIVDVATDARVGQLKTQAASNVACPFAKNLVAQEIKSIVDGHLAHNPLRYVVIVGNDDSIPFFRYPDQSLLGPESGYVPPVSSSSASEASLRNNFVLGQDAYGAVATLSLRASEFPVLGLAVGRLVETPAEIAGMIDAYVAANGTIATASSLVTGYDFLQDAATAVRTELEAGTNRPADALITPNNVSPADTRTYANGGPWKAADLRQKLLNARHDVVFLAGHFSANLALAADFNSYILTSELAAGNFTNALVFSAGCHSGYNIVDADAINGVTYPLDWAQAFAQQKATLIAGTGYQYGDTDFIEYSERLYLNFAKELRAGIANEKIAIGEALVKAKIAYLAATPDLRGLHEKAVLEATLFGLPMMSVNMPGVRTGGSGNGGVITTAAPSFAGPGATLGLQIADPPPYSPALVSHPITLKNFDNNSTIVATWLSGPDGTVTNPSEPALPLQIVNVTPINSSLVLRGVGFRGATFSDSSVVPLTGAPATELRGVHTPFASPVFYPMRLWTTNYFGVLARPDGATKLLITPAQHQARDVAAGTSTLRKYSNLAVRLYYSDLTTAVADPARRARAAASLADAPTIVRVDAVPNAGLATFSAQVVGDPAAGIHEVWVTYTNTASTLTSLDLRQCVAPLPAACGTTVDSQYWKGQVATASLPANAKYIVQAVNGVGLVSVDDNLGRYYAVGSATAPAATTIAFNPAPPTAAAYGSSPSITAVLKAGVTGISNKLVTISAGGAARTGVTDAAGIATVAVPMLSPPGTYPVTASFGGDDAYLPSAVTTASALSISKGATALTPPLSGVGAVLKSGDQPLVQESIQFLVNGPQGVLQVFAITDYTGRASIPAPGSPAGTYNVIQACYAGNAAYLGTKLNANPSCGYQFSGFSGISNPPAVNNANSGQAIPIKFSLGGNRGMKIFALDSPASQAANCSTFAPTGPLELMDNPGNSSMSYSGGSDQYQFVWKTDKAWAKTCRVAVFTLNDGSQYRANFNFTK